MDAFLGLMVIAFGIYFVTSSLNQAKHRYIKQQAVLSNRIKVLEDEITECLSRQNFSKTQHIMGKNKETGLAFDEVNKKICLLFASRACVISSQIFSYKDVLSVEIVEDGETITSTVRSSQIGGALIGGIALGGIGAVIGGLSGKTKTSGAVRKIILRLVVNNTGNPLHEVSFLNLETGIKKIDARYQEAMQLARHWHSLIEVLIKRADMEDKENVANNVVQVSQNSIADEIKKLAELREAGILSDIEFQQQKEKLLG